MQVIFECYVKIRIKHPEYRILGFFEGLNTLGRFDRRYSGYFFPKIIEDMIMNKYLGENFYRNQLNSEGKNCYDQIYQHLLSGQPNHNCTVHFLKESNHNNKLIIIHDSLCAIRYDHPELFFMSIESKVSTFGRMAILNMKQRYSNDEINNLNHMLAKLVVNNSRPLKAKSQWQIEKSIYEFVCSNYQYSKQIGKSAHSVAGFLCYGKGVCEAYSDMMIIMLRYNNIPAIRVHGKVDGENHCWVMAWIDGKPYHVDPTGDIVKEELSENVFRFFNLSDYEISCDHIIDSKYHYPVCNSMDANYYVHENRYCLNLNQLKDVLNTEIKRGGRNIWIKTGLSFTRISEVIRRMIPHCGISYLSIDDVVRIQIT